MSAPQISRFVAIGDSQTEGLWDGDDSVGIVGYADRLAQTINRQQPGLLYANLAVRGAMIHDVLAGQLDHALSMEPDLICACAGMNDVLWPGRSFDQALLAVDYMYERLAGTPALVLTTTFPDIRDRFPTARIQSRRVARLNAHIRAAARRYGFALVELDTAPSMRLPDTWSPDRMHGSPTGHARFAAAAAEALGLPGSNHDWAHADQGVDEHVFGTAPLTQLFLGHLVLVPALTVAGPVWRMMRGRPIRAAQPRPKHSKLGPVNA
ncbi:SGNH/GDSL hydrolase family protein [Mycobacterium sp. IDR2000157661]|uniref:SGNH/GDSL hydrolase family protein n=1 Tax=Mycobacterium sp. IDR2000157661 TaxID=2867005 RepID=UPI001EEDA417|nr:SGNH/GDSL hydrolase family protein [Mycobacterium sp. IDR2000157661]ULE35220.1 SGNH/GDSL hydrolase family protein [Mycobacterium sp. IDR2000157661]